MRSGIKSSLSLLELFAIFKQLANVKLSYTKLLVRESDKRLFVSDIAKAKELLKWQPVVSAQVSITRMDEWIEQ